MNETLTWFWVALAGISAVGVVLAQNPVRSIASFLCAVLCAAVVLMLYGQTTLAGLWIWLAGGAVGLLLLFTVLLLNLSQEETGKRRMQVKGIVTLVVVVYFAAAFTGWLSIGPTSTTTAAWEPKQVLGESLFEHHFVPLILIFLSLASVAIAALSMVRRRP